ncbi:hypothetical protein HPB49_004080 [Dermacentor silvarum]|uniref:Uncharacterized protein n=1 Tax=Dermacentor silvarum TaxID=543639 RepID=A0ACB8D2B4_DERSI|nr:hypothetical protein HPB49_004080 [Dermacentor silvarum]
MSTTIYEESECDTHNVLLQAPRIVHTLIDLRKFGNLQKLLCVTACLFPFVHRCRRMETSSSGTLSTEELNKAERFWICRVQLEVFTTDIEHLRLRDTVKKHSVLRDLHPYLDHSGQLRLERTNSGDGARSDLSKKLRYRQKLVDHLWIRWKKEYLLDLRTLHLYPSHPSSSLQVDDVVLIEQPNISRDIWPLGRVVDVFPCQDGIIRACHVKAQDGKFKRRPARKLYKLGLDNATGGRDYV